MHVKKGIAAPASPAVSATQAAGKAYSLPCSKAAVELARIYMAVSSEESALSATSKGGMSKSDKVNNVSNAIGSLGMILSAIRRPTDEQNTFGFAVLNDTEHVVVPYSVRCNGDFYATANLDILTPGQNSTLNFNINKAFDGNLDVYLNFAVCSKNTKSINASIHITRASSGEIAPYSFSPEYESIKFDRSEQSSSASTNTLLYAAAVGSDDFPSFGVAVVGAALNSHQLGLVLTPWRSV